MPVLRQCTRIPQFPEIVCALRYSLLVLVALNPRGDIAYFLQCRFDFHQIVDVEFDGIAIPFPHPAGNEDSLVQRLLRLLQSGFKVISGVLRILCGHTPGSVSRREILFAFHVTTAFIRNKKGVFAADTRRHALAVADTKKAGTPRFHGTMPACIRLFRQIVCPVRYVMRLLFPFRLRLSFQRSRLPHLLHFLFLCRRFSCQLFRLFQGWRGSGQNSWRYG